MNIKLTDSSPVEINANLWDLIAAAHVNSFVGDDLARETQAIALGELTHWNVRVREFGSDVIVYGEDTLGAYAGEIVNESETVETIRRICDAIGAPRRLATACIGDLPTVECL